MGVRSRSEAMRQFDEYFWGGYLTALVKSGAVTSETPREEVLQMKAEFMAGIRGEAPSSKEPS